MTRTAVAADDERERRELLTRLAAGMRAAGRPVAMQAEREVREAVARQILAQREECPEPYHWAYPRPSCWTCARNGAFIRAARIALGRF